MYKYCNQEIYSQALLKFFKRFSPYEIERKCKYPIKSINNLLLTYLEHADYSYKPTGSIWFNMDVYVVINKDIEFDLPHTLDNIIIMPKKYIGSEYILQHELKHIYFRYFKCNLIDKFCNDHNIIIIKRTKTPAEITNPDTYYNCGLNCPDRIIFVVLEWGPVSKYYVYMKHIKKVLPANTAEINYYNKKLPYSQNYHPEEILAGFNF